MNLKKTIIFSLILVLLTFSITGLFLKNRIKTRATELFRMNRILQEEGYYMAEFEFKMMGIVYYLDKGHYRKAFSTLSRFHSQLKNRENIIKVPEFRDTEDEMNFYLNLQNPRTGAFMDDSFPYCTFNEPTENVVNHLDELAKSSGVPLRLKYPLKYLDRINTTEKLYDFLDDVSYIGWIGSRFPETTFVFARSLLSYCNDEGIIIQNNFRLFQAVLRTTRPSDFEDHFPG